VKNKHLERPHSFHIFKTLFIKKSDFAVILVQIYVDDIIFGSSNDKLNEDFVKAM